MRRAFITCKRADAPGHARIAVDAIEVVISCKTHSSIGKYSPDEKTVLVVVSSGKSYEVQHTTDEVFAMAAEAEAQRDS